MIVIDNGILVTPNDPLFGAIDGWLWGAQLSTVTDHQLVRYDFANYIIIRSDSPRTDFYAVKEKLEYDLRREAATGSQ